MDTFILIDGIACWILIIVFLISFFLFIVLVNGYLQSQRQNDLKDGQLRLKDRQLSELQADYDLLLKRYKKATFKVPDLDEGKADGSNK